MGVADDRRSKAMDSVNASPVVQASHVATKLRLQQQVAAIPLTSDAVQGSSEIPSGGQSSYDGVLDVTA
jgi:hypothetical protein